MGSTGSVLTLPGIVPFPSSSQFSAPTVNKNYIVTLDQPLYFNKSLLIQVKGTVSAGSLQAFAKIRY